MLGFCQPVSYYAKLSVLWVKKLLSEVEHLTYSPISPIPYPLSDSLNRMQQHVIKRQISSFHVLQDCICRANHSSSLPILPWEKRIAFAEPITPVPFQFSLHNSVLVV